MSGRGNVRARPASAVGGRSSSPSAPAPRPASAENNPSSLSAALAKLTRLAPPTPFPANPPFPGVESDAHTWGIPLMAKYLREELELPGYEEAFERVEMTGLKFICLDLALIKSKLPLEHPLHAHKIEAYAGLLRERVLEKASIQRPLRLGMWAPVHVAGWLSFKLGCHTCALLVLRGSLDGQTACELDEAALGEALGGDGTAPTEEVEQAVAGLLGLREAQKRSERPASASPPSSSSSSSSSSGSGGMAAKVASLLEGSALEAPEASKASSKPRMSRLKSRRLEEKGNDEEAVAVAEEACGESATVADRGEASEEAKDSPALPEHAGPTVDVPPYPAAAKAKKKKAKKGAAPGPGADGALPASAQASAETDKLSAKIEALTQMVQGQQAAMRELEEQAQAAKRERAAAERRLQAERDAVEALQQDLQGASRAIDSVSKQYLAGAAAAKSVRKDEVQQLQRETRELQQAAKDLATATKNKPVPTTPQGKTASVGQPSPPSPPSTPGSMAPPDYHLATASPVAVKEMADNTSPSRATAQVPAMNELAPTPAPASAPAPAPPAPAQSLALTSKRPLAAASALLGVDVMSDGDGAAAVLGRERSMKSALEESAATELKVWRALLRRYRHAATTSLTVADTTVQLSRIACLWLRLGMQMLDDARGGLPPPPSTSRPSRPSEEMEGTDEALLPPSKELVLALQGLQRCARQLLLLQAEEGVSETPALAPAPPSNEKLITKVRLRPSATPPAKSGPAPVPPRASEVRRRDYELAVGMVFALGLVRRLLDRYPDKKDQTNLLFLFTRLRDGSLPLSELSRENVRAMLKDTLSISLPDWAQFDAVCQRFDPEGKGLVTAQRTLQLFQNLNPLGDGLGPGDAQGLCLLNLSMASHALSRPGKDCQEALVDLVAAGGARVATFAALARGDFDANKPEGADKNKNLSTKIFQSDADDKENSGGPGEVSNAARPPSAKSAKLADETLLVSDLLSELCRDFVTKQHRHEATAGGGTELAPLPLRRDARAKDEWRRARASTTCPLSFLPPTPHNLTAACHLVARGLAVYEGRGQQLLTAMETLFTTHLTFRRACLLRMKAAEEASELEQVAAQAQTHMAGGAALTAGPRLRQHASMHLTLPHIRHALGAAEASLVALMGMARAQQAMRRADGMRIESLERVMAELCGVPVPHGGVLGLVRSQTDVEIFLHHEQVKVREADLQHSLESLNKAYSSSLRDVQASLLAQLQLAGTNVGAMTTGPLSPTRQRGGPKDKEVNAAGYAGLLGEMGVLMFRQRVEQAASYLVLLNERAAAKRRLLEAALQLWQATKNLAMSPSKRKRTGLQDAVSMTFTGASGLSVEVPLLSCGPEELGRRAQALQRAVLEDMHRVPSAAQTQLAQRVNGIKRGVSSGSIVDEDQSLAVVLREIGNLEGGLLQANEDVLGVTERVMESVLQY